MEKDKTNYMYMGDDVYVANDGYSLYLAVDNDHGSAVLALDFLVMDRLITYYEQLKLKIKEDGNI